MIIDPQGILRGDRIAACSDEAQLHFPRLLAASNSFGRFRMSVEWLQTEVYRSFKQKPTKPQLTAWLREFHDNFLLFVYRAPDNSVWAQWEIPEKMLGRYRLAADKKTPAPPTAEHEAYRSAYLESIRAKNSPETDEIYETFQNIPQASVLLRSFSQASDDVRNVSHDVGVGVGDGVGDVYLAQPPASPVPSPAPRSSSEPHPLHTPCRLAILDYWSKHVQPGTEPAWDGGEAKELSNLLRALPSLTIERFRIMLEHRGQSDVNLSERPRKWIASLPNYELGPLDAFGKPRTRRSGPGGQSGVPRPPDASTTSQMLTQQQSERQRIVDDWRQVRDRGDPEYGEAPGWVRQQLDGNGTQQQAVA